MKRRYFELLAEVFENTKTIEQADACMHRYSADEEPSYRILIATTWNSAQEMVYGDRAKRYQLPFLARVLKQFFRLNGWNLKGCDGMPSQGA